MNTKLSGCMNLEKVYNKKNQFIVTHDNESLQLIKDFSNKNLEENSSRRIDDQDQIKSDDYHFKMSRASS